MVLDDDHETGEENLSDAAPASRSSTALSRISHAVGWTRPKQVSRLDRARPHGAVGCDTVFELDILCIVLVLYWFRRAHNV